MSELQIIEFESAEGWSRWLATNGERGSGIWLRFYKKGSGVAGISYGEALEAALCHGWIDGQVKRHDDLSYLQKFTPRRPKSIWSKRNIERVERLIAAGKMTQRGMEQVEAAKADGRWERAYSPPSQMLVPQDFLSAVAKNRKANATFQKLNKANLYAIAWRLQTAKKPETRERRLRAIIQTLAERKTFH